MANAGMQMVKLGLVGTQNANNQSNLLLSAGETILSYIPDDGSSQRGRALIAMREGNLDTASELWQLSGAVEWLQQRGDAIQLDGVIAPFSTINAMTWYLMAEPTSRDDPAFWQGVGQLCRMNRQRDLLCTRYLEQNDGNLLLNPDFELAFDGWTVPASVGSSVNMVDCDGRARCVQISSDDATPALSATLFQCMTIEVGAVYQFSAEIAITHNNPTARWLPLYIQGAIDGDIRDFHDTAPLPQDAAFRPYKVEFSGLNFDDGLVCFHPARFADKANILVKNLRLEKQ